MDINSLWKKIVEHEGECFRTIKGIEFTYAVVGDKGIKTSRTDFLLTKRNFENALKFCPLTKPSDLGKSIMGTAYVYGILSDARMR